MRNSLRFAPSKKFPELEPKRHPVKALAAVLGLGMLGAYTGSFGPRVAFETHKAVYKTELTLAHLFNGDPPKKPVIPEPRPGHAAKVHTHK